MNWDQVEGKWDEIKARVRQQWGKLTDDDLEQAAGRRDRLLGRLKQRYGETKENFGEKLDDLIDRL